MGRFSDAKANSDNPTVIRKALNYLAELLDRWYETKLTIAGKKIIISINPQDGMLITVNGVKVFGIDSSGRVFASSISNVDDPDFYMTYGYSGSPGIECFAPTIGKWLGISPTVTSGIALYDVNTDRRMEIYSNGSFTISDSNIIRFFIDGAGSFAIWDASGILRIEASNTRSQIKSPDGTNALSVDNTSISMSGLPVFANNAAALAGGLSIGHLYRTNGDPDLLCIVH